MNGITLAVIYDGKTGSAETLARAASHAGAETGADVRLLPVAEATPADLEWADVVVFGTASRYGSMCADFKQFLDSTGDLWLAGKLADKVYGAFVCGSDVHGGHETTLEHFATVFSHWGGIIVPPGGSAPTQFLARRKLPRSLALEAAGNQTRRAVEVAARLQALPPAAR